MNAKIFREYDIRGVADRDIPSPLAVDIARAAGSMLREHGGKTMTLGRDCRLSSSRLHDAILEGLLSAGIQVIDVGLVPTPGLYFSIPCLQADGGIMITGSHNPSDQNGFKICIGPATIHGEEIQDIARRVREKEFSSGKGSVRADDISDRYIDRMARDIRSPLGIRVAVDSGNGMAGQIAPRLLRKIGCEVFELFSELDGRFPHHHPDPTQPENLEDLAAAVKRHGCQLGIGFDGDADRIGAVDSAGKAIFGDELLILYSRAILSENPGATVISEVKASQRLFDDVESHGGKPIQWKTGHSLIKAKMRETGALLAGEMSGHMFFNDKYYGFDDAIYAAARLCEIVARQGKTPSDLLADLPPAFSTPEIRVDCSDDVKFQVVENARRDLERAGYRVNSIDGARVEMGDGWGLVRASNTQPVLVYRFEAQSESRLAEIRNIVESAVARHLPRQ